MKKKLLTLAAIVAFSLTGCCDKSYEMRLKVVRDNTRLEKHYVDQVFKDGDECIIVYQDKNGNVHKERYELDGVDGDMKGSPLEYYTRMIEFHNEFKELNQNTKQAIVICTDLKPYEQGYVVMLKSRVNYCKTINSITDCDKVKQKKDMYFMEIHLPQKQQTDNFQEHMIYTK